MAGLVFVLSLLASVVTRGTKSLIEFQFELFLNVFLPYRIGNLFVSGGIPG